jgi:hypothetical protein
MISQAIAAGAAPAPPAANAPQPAVTAEYPDGDFFDVFMLQFHVTMAMLWLIVALVVAVMSVPRLRKLPSASGLHFLQVRRPLIGSALFGLYLLALSTGIYLMFQQAAYDDPPVNGDDWEALKEKPYAVPYFYALYGKIGLFILMGIATYILAREAKKASKESEDAGGPVEEDPYAYDDEDTYSYSSSSSGSGIGTTRLTTYAAAQKKAAKLAAPKRTVHVVPLWMAVGILVIGIAGIAFCVTLLKYFHELSKAAVVYEILKLRG